MTIFYAPKIAPVPPSLAQRESDMDKLREAVEHLLNTCPPIDANGEEAHARARAALAEPVADEPVAFMWQHDETGRTGFCDRWQKEHGFEQNNPRLKIVAPLYTRPAPAPDRLDWDRVHHALAKHGEHPGRTDDHLADVIDRVLTRLKAPAPTERGEYLPLPADDKKPHVVKVPGYGYVDVKAVRAIERAHGIGAKP